MNVQKIRWSLMALGACAAMLSTSAHAVWTFNTGSSTVAGTNAGDPSVSLSGFSATNTSGAVTGTWAATPANTSGNGAGGVAYFGNSGVGMYTSGETSAPQHAVDNSVRTEAVLLNFGGVSTALTSIGLGWTSNGTTSNCAGCASTTGVSVDLSLFRWTGTTGPVLNGAAAALGGSWELVGNYGMVYDTINPYNTVNTAGKTSSWWLISAYNSGFVQSTGRENRGSALTNGNDYFKLFGVAGTKCATTLVNGTCSGTSTGRVPEPATLALTSVALLGVAGLRRRRSLKAA